MKRRNFLKNTAVLSSAVLVAPSLAFSNEKQNPFGITSNARKFSLINTYDINQNDEITQAWIPLPKDETYHRVIGFSYDGNFTEAKVVKNDYNTRVLYVKWDKLNNSTFAHRFH